MGAAPTAWGPREGKVRCVVELDLPLDIEYAPAPLGDVLRMCIDVCVSTPRPAEEMFAAMTAYTRDHPINLFRHRSFDESWKPPVVEVLSPTTLFIDTDRPGVCLNLSMPPEIVEDQISSIRARWADLTRDLAQHGMVPFLGAYKMDGVLGGVPYEMTHLRKRWNFFLMMRLVCVKRSRGLAA